MNIEEKHLGVVSGYYEELERIFTLAKEEYRLGNEKKVKRLLVEDLYNLLFAQYQHMGKEYRITKKILQKYPKASPIVREYSNQLEQDRIKSRQLLIMWGNDVEENKKNWERIYQTQSDKTERERNK